MLLADVLGDAFLRNQGEITLTHDYGSTADRRRFICGESAFLCIHPRTTFAQRILTVL
jgi:hypothetical protein